MKNPIIIIPGWWFKEHEWIMTFHILLGRMILTYSIIFWRGFGIPPTSEYSCSLNIMSLCLLKQKGPPGVWTMKIGHQPLWVFAGNVNPGLINYGLLIRGGYSSNSHNLVLFYGTLPIIHSRKRGLWKSRVDSKLKSSNKNIHFRDFPLPMLRLPGLVN